MISVLFWVTCGITMGPRVIPRLSNYDCQTDTTITFVLRCRLLLELFCVPHHCEYVNNRLWLAAYASTGNMIARACRTYIISVPKCDRYTYIQMQNKIQCGISCLVLIKALGNHLSITVYSHMHVI